MYLSWNLHGLRLQQGLPAGYITRRPGSWRRPAPTSQWKGKSACILPAASSRGASAKTDARLSPDSASLEPQAGLKALETYNLDGILLALADQPLVPAAHLVHLVTIQRRTNQLIVASEYAGTVGVPALLMRAVFDDLRELKPNEGCKRVIHAHCETAGFLPCPEAEYDIDTPEDFAALAVGAPRSAWPWYARITSTLWCAEIQSAITRPPGGRFSIAHETLSASVLCETLTAAIEQHADALSSRLAEETIG
jgi:2-phospho-L-lactate guanylyltransferase (CobY/MobA/RfbA family)